MQIHLRDLILDDRSDTFLLHKVEGHTVFANVNGTGTKPGITLFKELCRSTFSLLDPSMQS